MIGHLDLYGAALFAWRRETAPGQRAFPVNGKISSMSGLGYERHRQEGTGHGESTPSSGLKILVPDTGQDDPNRASSPSHIKPVH